MKQVLIMPVLVTALMAAACSDDPTVVVPTARVRFFNATTDMGSNGGFTTNQQFAAGSTLPFGQSTCSSVNAGPTSFGFGPAGTTGLTGSALATLNSQTVVEGGNYIVVAAGSATSPQMFLIDNSFSGTLGTNQAAVRFVNLAPATPENPKNFVVYLSALGPNVSPDAINIAVGEPTTFKAVSSGSNEFTVLKTPGHVIEVSGSEATFNLQAGSVNTLAIVPNSSGGHQLIHLPRCS